MSYPPYGQPDNGQWPIAPMPSIEGEEIAPPRRRRRWPWIVLAVIAAVCVGGNVIGFAIAFSSHSKDHKAPKPEPSVSIAPALAPTGAAEYKTIDNICDVVDPAPLRNIAHRSISSDKLSGDDLGIYARMQCSTAADNAADAPTSDDLKNFTLNTTAYVYPDANAAATDLQRSVTNARGALSSGISVKTTEQEGDVANTADNAHYIFITADTYDPTTQGVTGKYALLIQRGNLRLYVEAQVRKVSKKATPWRADELATPVRNIAINVMDKLQK